MKVPAEITYRNVEKTEAIDQLVREKIGKLEQVCDHISSCRVAVEKAHDRPDSGSPYRVRIDLTVPPSHELAAVRNPGEGNLYDPLEAVIRGAFDAARRQLSELVERQQRKVKHHPSNEMVAIVTQLFPEEDYGFLRTTNTGREVYFHRESLAQEEEFDQLEVGTGVQCDAYETERGPRATTVRIVNKPGERVPKTEENQVEQPKGWS